MGVQGLGFRGLGASEGFRIQGAGLLACKSSGSASMLV